MKTLKLYYILLSFAFLLVVTNCNEREWNNPLDANINLTVTTSPASEITSSSTILGGNIASVGGLGVTERGICYSTTQNPTTASNTITMGNGIGSFSKTVSGLFSNTTYYVRAYANNGVGTVYGNEVYFTTSEGEVVIPTLSTTAITSITDTTASSGGNITSNGGATVTERGIWYGSTTNPETSGTKLQIGSGIGVFSTSLIGLIANTKYYIVAYATNSAGTAYGNEISFTTTSGGGTGETGTITDSRDGNTYKTVKIGTQWWLAENLAYLPSVSPSPEGSDTNQYYYVYEYEGSSVSEAKATAHYSTYGVLYNWPAAMNGAASSAANPSGVQGVCPTGWHLPSDDEWHQITNYLGESLAGGKLKETGTTHWTSPNQGATNETGFTAFPGGFRARFGYGTFELVGKKGYWWSSTDKNSSNAAWYWYIEYDDSYIRSFYSFGKQYGYSVRCVRDN